MLSKVNTSKKTVEEEIFRNFVMHHLINAVRLPSLSTISENDIPQPLQPFINPYHNDCKEDHNEEWAVFQRIQAERFFKGKDSFHKEKPPTDTMSEDSVANEGGKRRSRGGRMLAHHNVTTKTAETRTKNPVSQ